MPSQEFEISLTQARVMNCLRVAETLWAKTIPGIVEVMPLTFSQVNYRLTQLIKVEFVAQNRLPVPAVLGGDHHIKGNFRFYYELTEHGSEAFFTHVSDSYEFYRQVATNLDQLRDDR